MKQARGDSLRRQADAAEKWAAERGWKLDDLRATDRARSAFTGENRHKGDLGKLLEMIENGRIPEGSYLLLEALDRLSREELLESVPMFIQIIKRGVIVITLNDNKEWNKAGLKNMPDFMYSVMLLAKAHEESLHKGGRVRSKFEEGRKKGSRKEFGSAPGWLKRKSKEHPWEVIEERAEAVRKVFELAVSGFGSKAIAKQANEEKWPIPTRDTETKPKIWHGAMPGRLLRMREVLGSHEYRLMGYEEIKERKWRGKATGIVIPDYYPQIVSEELWHRARASIETRKTGNVRRDENYFNIWSGLLRCGECGAMVQRKTETKGRSKAQLTCSNKIAGITNCATGAAAKTDGPLLFGICAVAGAQMGLGYDKNESMQKISIAKSKLKECESKAINVANGIAAVGPMPELMQKAREIEQERKELGEIIKKESEKIALEPNSMMTTEYAEEIMQILYEKGTKQKEERADCNRRLKQAIEGIWHFAYDCCLVKYKGSKNIQHIPLTPKTKNCENPNPKFHKFAAMLTAEEPEQIKLPGLAALES